MDGQSSIVAAPVVGRQPAAPVTAPGQGSRMDLEALAAPCTPHGLSPAELPDPADGLVLVLLAPASVLVPALVPRALKSVAQVASLHLQAKLHGRSAPHRSNVADVSSIPRPRKDQ